MCNLPNDFGELSRLELKLGVLIAGQDKQSDTIKVIMLSFGYFPTRSFHRQMHSFH